MIFETGLSTLNISRTKRAPNTINFVDMRLVLVFLATFLQSLFNLFNVQNLIGLYALYNIRQRQMLALAALNRRRWMQRRWNRRFRFWCLPRPRQSWFEIAVASCAHVLSLKKKNCYFTAIGQDMTCFEAGHRLFWSLGPSDIVMAGCDKRVALVAGTRWQILCPM